MTTALADLGIAVPRPFKGHLIVSDSCEFFLVHDVFRAGRAWRVSTIGEYRSPIPDYWDRDELTGFDRIGYKRLYETMVFTLTVENCGCGCGAPRVADFQDLLMAPANSRADAADTHEAVVEWFRRGCRGEPDLPLMLPSVEGA